MDSVHKLRVFLAAADSLSFTTAGKGLFLTQSAVSHQIANLETELGAQLFDRLARGVELTAAGRELLGPARRAIVAMDDVEEAVRKSANPASGRLRIGATGTACQYLIPEALREFRECFPDYSLSILPDDTPALTEQLHEGRIDLAVVIRQKSDADRRKLAYHPLFVDQLGVLISPLHPWARAGKVDRAELSTQPLFLYSRTSATFQILQQYFSRLGTMPQDWIELGSMEAMKEFVRLSLGAGIVAPWIARPELEIKSLVWLPLPGPAVKRSWCIASSASKKLSAAEQTFIGLCSDVAKNFSSYDQ